MMNAVFVSLVFLSWFSLASAEDVNKINSNTNWVNQAGSSLQIGEIEENGLFKGTYINRAKGYSCQNIPYPVTGWVNGTALTFTVKWQHPEESCGSLTAWTGFLSGGKITTEWQLVKDQTTEVGQLFKGTAIFTKTP